MGKVYSVDNNGQVTPLAPYECRDEEKELQDHLERCPDLLVGEQIDPTNPRRWLQIQREMDEVSSSNQSHASTRKATSAACFRVSGVTLSVGQAPRRTCGATGRTTWLRGSRAKATNSPSPWFTHPDTRCETIRSTAWKTI